MEISSDNPEHSEFIKPLNNEEICSKGIDDSHIHLDDSKNSTGNLHLPVKKIPFACSSAEDSNQIESSTSSRYSIKDNCDHELVPLNRKCIDYEDDIKNFEPYTSDSFLQMLHLCEVLENLDLNIEVDESFCTPTNCHFSQNPVAVKSKETTDKQNSTFQRRNIEDIHFDFSLKQTDISESKKCGIDPNFHLCLDPLYYDEKSNVASLKRKHEYEGGNIRKDLSIPDTPQTLVLLNESNKINFDINFQASKKKKSA